MKKLILAKGSRAGITLDDELTVGTLDPVQLHINQSYIVQEDVEVWDNKNNKIGIASKGDIVIRMYVPSMKEMDDFQAIQILRVPDYVNSIEEWESRRKNGKGSVNNDDLKNGISDCDKCE